MPACHTWASISPVWLAKLLLVIPSNLSGYFLADNYYLKGLDIVHNFPTMTMHSYNPLAIYSLGQVWWRQAACACHQRCDIEGECQQRYFMLLSRKWRVVQLFQWEHCFVVCRHMPNSQCELYLSKRNLLSSNKLTMMELQQEAIKEPLITAQ